MVHLGMPHLRPPTLEPRPYLSHTSSFGGQLCHELSLLVASERNPDRGHSGAEGVVGCLAEYHVFEKTPRTTTSMYHTCLCC